MNKQQELFDYLATLTPEQKDKLIDNIPLMISAMSEQEEVCCQAKD